MPAPQAQEILLGIDFGAPSQGRAQRKKIIVVAGERVQPRHYHIALRGINLRLMRDPPGWSALELLELLLSFPFALVAIDCPIGLPISLLDHPRFAKLINHPHPFGSWWHFSAAVADRLPLKDPLDFKPFERWRDPSERNWIWEKRMTDRITRSQPPLKSAFPCIFNMTILGHAIIYHLRRRGIYRVIPFDANKSTPSIIEVYPRATLSSFGLHSYKGQAKKAVDLAIRQMEARGIALEIDPPILARSITYRSSPSDNDLADALIALFTGILYFEGMAHPAFRGDEKVMRREGVIWQPTPQQPKQIQRV
ncbi:MAG: hypothetical protein RMJ84_10060 [Sandaracinaceae bacterium]|nr:hypothetical protein [Sandaracinaceae bacterium]